MAGFDESELPVLSVAEATEDQNGTKDAAYKAAAGLRRCRVYVAGPMSLGDRVSNFSQAVIAMREVILLGAAPMVPQLSFLVGDLLRDVTYGQWLQTDLAWVEAADVVLRLPGKSSGAEVECQLANRLGIPVVHSLVDLRKIVDKWSASASASA